MISRGEGLGAPFLGVSLDGYGWVEFQCLICTHQLGTGISCATEASSKSTPLGVRCPQG